MIPSQTRTTTRTSVRMSRALSALFALILLLSGTPSTAQPDTPPTAGGNTLDDLLGGENAPSFPTTGSQEMPVERSVDPNSYRVGPNDQLMISSTGNAFSIPVVVGYDNTIVLPRGIAPLNVEGMTLTQLRHSLDSVFRARSAGYGTISVSLVKPRVIYVTVTGNVIAPGRYVVTSADRATTAIALANQIPEELASSDEQFMDLTKKSLLGNRSQFGSRNLGATATGSSATRHIIIRHTDGTTSDADLIRYRAFGSSDDNPTLREGDHIIVEVPDPFGELVSIAGAVINPMVGQPYRPGDNALMLVNLSAGPRDDADVDNAYILRVGSGREERIPIDLSDTAMLSRTPLVGGDQIIVPVIERSRAVRSGVVTLVGEVVRPQAYSIVPGVTSLSQVIEMAGGFTPFASLNGSYIRRPDDPLALRPDIQVLDPKAGISTSTLALEDTTRFMFDQQIQQNLVSADFVAIFTDRATDRDVILQSGDVIVVPREMGQVFVKGRVEHPGWVHYVPGKDFFYYITMAGGYTAAAADDRVVVEKFGTGIWNDVCCTPIESGDQIYVPGERDTPARTALERASTILAIVASILLISETFINIFNKLFPDEP